MSPRLKALTGALAVILFLVIARMLHLQDALGPLLDRLGAMGPRGAALFVLLYVVATVLFVPGSILTLGAGAVFGIVRGFVVVWAGATLGATAAFLVSRYLARDWVAARLSGHPRFRAVDEAVGREGWKIVGLTRLTPVLPFCLLNYAFGLTRVSLRDYVLASWIGMLPGAAFYVYLGSLAGEAAGLSSRAKSGAQWSVLIVGLAAGAGVIALITRIARQALEKRL